MELELDLHEEPQIPNYGFPDRDRVLNRVWCLAIEPMVNIGERYVRTLEDNWTVVTEDGSWCAHFEHTVAVTENGFEILTILREQVGDERDWNTCHRSVKSLKCFAVKMKAHML